MKKILPVILIIIGVLGGGAAGVFLKPPAVKETEGGVSSESSVNENPDENEQLVGEETPADRAFVKVGRQTIIPVLQDGDTKALMLFELAVDVTAGSASLVHEMEPRLRDAFLRELFQMSYTGAFMTEFTDDRIIAELRRNLTRAARKHVGKAVREVLILDVMRQEM